MKYLLALFSAISLAAGAPGAAREEDESKPATIKVLLGTKEEGTLLEAKGPFVVCNPHTGKVLGSARKGRRYYVSHQKEGIKWGKTYANIFQIAVMPTSSDTTLLLDGIEYRGSIELYVLDDHLTIINEVDVESYLRSILSTRFVSTFPSSVMDAIAIIARTDAYYTALANHDAFWHVKAEAVGYNGYAFTALDPDVEHAIDSTRHLVMTYEGQPFAATWNTNCAGKTASFQSIFRRDTQAPSGVDVNFAAKDREESRWSLDIPASELARIAQANRVTGLDLYIDHLSDKVYAIKVRDGTRSKDVDFITLQKALGEDRLLSNDFTVELDEKMVHFRGYGVGHGVGLCLYSSIQMAKKGDSAPEILDEFYPETKLDKMRSYPPSVITATSSRYFIAPHTKKEPRP